MRVAIAALLAAVLLLPSPAYAAPNEKKSDSKTEKLTIPPSVPDPAYAAFDASRYMEAKKLAEEAAAKGDAPSDALLGQLYDQGLGVPRDFKKAAEWYAKGAAQGDPHSQFALGVMLAEGRGIQQNKKLAAQFFEMAAAKNHAIAIYNLAPDYVDGEARPQDFQKAYQLMLRAAELDYAPAQYDLAAFFKDGRGSGRMTPRQPIGSARRPRLA